MASEQVQPRKSWRLVAGQPLPYLNGLRDGKFARSAFTGDRERWPHGKLRFERFLERHQSRTPRSIARIVDGMVFRNGIGGAGEDVADFLRALPPGNYFCKPDDANCGAGAIRLDVTAHGVTVDGAEKHMTGVQRALSERVYIVQRSLLPSQHPDIARFNPSCLNTLRVVTFDTPAGVAVAGAAMRFGAGRTVDNWAAGGVLVPLDLDNAVMGQPGLIKKPLTAVHAHPKTGVAFARQRVPYLDEAIALVRRLHRRLAANSLGWDIALLSDGPCIVECNIDWDIYLSGQIDSDFIPRFLRFHLPAPSGSAIRLKLTGDFSDTLRTRLWICDVIGRNLANGRIARASFEELVVIVAGATSSIDGSLRELTNPPARFRIRQTKAARGPDTLRTGLDLRVLLDDVSSERETGSATP